MGCVFPVALFLRIRTHRCRELGQMPTALASSAKCSQDLSPDLLMVGSLIEASHQLVLSTCVLDSAKPVLQWLQVHFPSMAPGCLQSSDSGPPADQRAINMQAALLWVGRP